MVGKQMGRGPVGLPPPPLSGEPPISIFPAFKLRLFEGFSTALAESSRPMRLQEEGDFSSQFRADPLDFGDLFGARLAQAG